MTTDSADDRSISPAGEAYAAFLSRCEADQQPDFDAFCAERPDLADALHQLHDRYLRLFGSATEVASTPTLFGRIERRYGSGILPGVSLDDRNRRLSEEMVERIERRRREGGRYATLDDVGKGGMGVVKRVWDEDLRRTLAMKVMLDQASGSKSEARSTDPRMLSRFLEEAQITGQLDHPGVVPVHELGLDDDGSVWFTMRLVRGREFGEVIRDARDGTSEWNRARAVGVVQRISETMAFAHSKGVIHRDLKPSNVMVGEFGETYVMDWGLARVLGDESQDRATKPALPDAEETASGERVRTDRRDESAGDSTTALLTREGVILGTPLYMPPEQAQGDMAAVLSHSDIYSVGAILYHLLTGHPPYVTELEDRSGDAVLRILLRRPPRPIAELDPGAPAELVAICDKAMARRPEQRYADMLEMSRDLRAWLEGRVVSAYERGAWAELRKWIGRNRALAASLAALLVVFGIGSVLFHFQQADANRRLQQEKAEVKKRSDDVFRLSALRNLEELEAELIDLWPATPQRIDAYRSWLERAGELVAGLDGFRSLRDQLIERASPATRTGEEADGLRMAQIAYRDKLLEQRAVLEEQREDPRYTSSREDIDNNLEVTDRNLETLDAQMTAARPHRFDTLEDRWWHEQLDQLVTRLEAFADPETGPISGRSPGDGPGIERRLRFAESVRDRSIDGETARQLWDEAIRSISDRDACPAYAGLGITPQLGLLPIGRDPHSGLWEFCHLASGEPPLRDGEGEIVWTAETGIILVLLPGGPFVVGAQADDPDGPRYDPQAHSREAFFEADLAPFFLSKCEVTMAQWIRFSGDNPSNYGLRYPGHTTLHPVENVSWDACAAFCMALDLEIPSEAQWEYGARGGTDTPFYTGEDRFDLLELVNLADQAARRGGADWSAIDDWPELDDGYMVHGPVNVMAKNPFGLHAVHGNVQEWCLDGLGRNDAYLMVPREGNGERLFTTNKYRIIRGGGFMSRSAQARSSARAWSNPNAFDADTGLRPARRLDP